MHPSHKIANTQQAALWNGVAGRAWVETGELLDRVFKPLQDLLVEATSYAPGDRVLDVGCGAGSTTLAVARLLGSHGRCTGIDISDAMIAAARAHAEQQGLPVAFIRADAQDYTFEPASFNRIISRFGVMFFDDSVRAFANLRRASTCDARLHFVAWRSAVENPAMTAAERAAAPLVPNLPARQPNAPGQFAFADEPYLCRVLEESGWDDVEVRPLDVPCTLPEKDLVRCFTRLGPLGRILHQVDEPLRTQVVEAVRGAFDPYVHRDEVRFTAACWMVSARSHSAS